MANPYLPGIAFHAVAGRAARRALIVAMLVAGASGCASRSVPLEQPAYDPRLLTGETVFENPVQPGEVPDIDMLAVNDDMRAFIARHVGEAKLAESRFEGLLRGLSREGYLNGTYLYDAGRTLTAAETFASKSGNCLSYTTMFVALARAANLHADYQIVNVPANWDADGGFLIRYTHINALLSGIKVDKRYTQEFTVDFNAVQPEPEYPRRRISDNDAKALFYSNQSVDQIVAGHARTGFALLRKALQLMPDNADLWLNLGAFYAKQGQPQMAILAHQMSLDLDPQNKSALSGLARGYERLGDWEKSEFYAEQVRNYRRKNAYFHFAMAQAQYDRGDYQSSLQSIGAAIDLKRGDPRFHFMQGLVQLRLGDAEAARRSFRKAQKLGSFDDLKIRYGDVLTGGSELPPPG